MVQLLRPENGAAVLFVVIAVGRSMGVRLQPDDVHCAERKCVHMVGFLPTVVHVHAERGERFQL